MRLKVNCLRFLRNLGRLRSPGSGSGQLIGRPQPENRATENRRDCLHSHKRTRGPPGPVEMGSNKNVTSNTVRARDDAECETSVCGGRTRREWWPTNIIIVVTRNAYTAASSACTHLGVLKGRADDEVKLLMGKRVRNLSVIQNVAVQ